MGMMKRVGLPIMEEMFFSGPGTRMEIWERVEPQLPDLQWETFKRFMSQLRSDGIIQTLPCTPQHPHTRIALTQEGQQIVQELLGS